MLLLEKKMDIHQCMAVSYSGTCTTNMDFCSVLTAHVAPGYNHTYFQLAFKGERRLQNC